MPTDQLGTSGQQDGGPGSRDVPASYQPEQEGSATRLQENAQPGDDGKQDSQHGGHTETKDTTRRTQRPQSS